MNRNKMFYGIAAIVVVAVVIYYVYGSGSSSSVLDGSTVSAAQMKQLKDIAVNQSLANAVGLGITVGGANINYPTKLSGGKPLVISGKPAIVYIGADYCPYCAVARWGLVLALMRFGNFTGLEYMTSSSTDSYANSPTFSFSSTNYSSPDVAFIAAETLDREGKRIANTTPLEDAIITSYGNGAIPFTDFGNDSVSIGAVVSPQVLQGKDWGKIISLLSDSGSTVAQAIIGSANVYTAYICESNATLMDTPQCKAGYVSSALSVH